MASQSDNQLERDAAGRLRSPATFASFRKGHAPRNKGRRTGGVVYDTKEVLQLLEAIPQRAPVHIRDRAIFCFLWRTGVGVSELSRVRLADLDLASKTVHVRRTPQRRERDIHVLGSAEDADWGWKQLEGWLELRARRGFVRSAPLFCIVEGGSKGGPVGAPHLRSSLKKYARAAELHGRFDLAGFRNTLAVEMHHAGVSVGRIQRQLGHDSIATTHTMLERLGVVQGVDDLRDYNPAGFADAPRAHVDMPEDVREVFDEARSIVAQSPRGASALLRLALQMLVVHLGEPGHDLNKAIGALVKKGLSVEVQQALDAIRVVGNESVHPGTLNMRDDTETAVALFTSLNFIVEQRITHPRRLQELYDTLPVAKRDGIANRDR